jgi:ELWxxDGT repeat protein
MHGARSARTFPRLGAVSAAIALALLAGTIPAGAADPPGLVKDIRAPGGSKPVSLAASGGTLFFSANDGVHGQELWKSDGTAKGTKLVKDIRPGAKGSKPSVLANVKGVVFFAADDGLHGLELWKSDGTRSGTKLVKDLQKPSPFGKGLWSISHLTRVGSKAFFFASFPNPGVENASLCTTDGTSAGTRCPVGWPGGVPDAVPLGGKLYFVLQGLDPGGQLWVSDGTKAGTKRVPGTPPNVGGPLTVVGRKLFFYASNDSGTRTHLWKTNGTSAGTSRLLRLGSIEPQDRDGAAFDDRLFFVNGSADAQGLWKSNGTVAGTKAVKSFPGGPVGDLTAVRAKLFFTHGKELWVTDGRPVGTEQVSTSEPLWTQALTKVGPLLAFVEGPDWGATGRPWALWRSDGVAAGTQEVAPFVGAFGDQETLPRAVVGGTLFFAADDGKGAGRELWSWTP